ncbi:phosphatidylinositol glycan, class M [Cryptococcus wingfieldii CBS 7118]|uniref:GPI mannosyltransferase 1 n=1 Tax=Cryptococcus wingfieldii CBS 7118 TaxID=1295528 RepID=A0A1E3JC56_9TREE|nr:phosphatidylinositol glycan, class M [Cryptococcus wingfieldii CBS 7118]ODN98437.1 phosphatidylinositol glycan, class M [Cryptococcus wingfieldii CBS 7118]
MAPASTPASTPALLALALAAHLALILYAEHVDAHPLQHAGLRYTDLDWRVLTDGARIILSPATAQHAAGPLARRLGWGIGDPYHRATFRYTPLLPLFLSPAILSNFLGKILLALPSLLIPVLLLSGPGPAPFWPTHLLWTLNPFTLNITTRGSPEAAICFLVVATQYFIRLGGSSGAKGRGEGRAALVLALAVSWKIYPAIYIPAIWKELAGRWGWFGLRVWRFGFIALVSFVAINGALWSIWGQPFLDHTYLYHLTRLDHRHNFSPYFYPIYLSLFPSSSQLSSAVITILRHPLTSFLPQLSLILCSSFIPAKLDFVFFLQTAIFVTFNKVCTSQYFMWFLPLLPPVLSHLAISRSQAILLVSAWVLAQAVWLASAYMLELQAQSVYLTVWAAGLGVFGASVWVLGELVESWR